MNLFTKRAIEMLSRWRYLGLFRLNYSPAGNFVCMKLLSMYVCRYYLFVQLWKSGDYKYTRSLKILFLCCLIQSTLEENNFFRSFMYKSFCFRNTFESELLWSHSVRMIWYSTFCIIIFSMQFFKTEFCCWMTAFFYCVGEKLAIKGFCHRKSIT